MCSYKPKIEIKIENCPKSKSKNFRKDGIVKARQIYEYSCQIPLKVGGKNLLDSKYERISKDENINIEIELATGIFKILYIEDVKDVFFSNFRNAYGKLNTELKRIYRR